MYAGCYHVSLAVFVRAEEYDGAWKRAQEGRSDATVKTPSYPFLSEDLGVCGG